MPTRPFPWAGLPRRTVGPYLYRFGQAGSSQFDLVYGIYAICLLESATPQPLRSISSIAITLPTGPTGVRVAASSV
jgi:hypothetical protein